MIVTPLYAGLLALWFLLLTLRVVQERHRTRISLGDGGDATLHRRIRGHANFAEYVPLALLMMGFLEVGHRSIYLLHALGIALVVARVLHGLALSFGWQTRFGRVSGAAITIVVMMIEALLCLYQGINGQIVWLQ